MITRNDIIQALSTLDPHLSTLILSFIPIIEPRFAIWAGVTIYRMSPLEALAVTTIGLFFLSLVITLLIEEILDSAREGMLSRIPLLHRLVIWLENRSLEKASPLIKRYGWIGLVAFVAVPLPFTGVYTGSIAGVLLGIKGKRMFIGLFVGGLISVLINFMVILGYY